MTSSMVSHTFVCGFVGRAEVADHGQRVGVRGPLGPFEFAQPVGENLDAAAGEFLRVEQADRAGRQVAWVLIFLKAGLFPLSVQPGERGPRHVRLAAGLEDGRRLLAAQFHRHFAHRPQVVRDVVADFAVAARRRRDELAVLVPQTNRDAVDLQLNGIRKFFVLELLPNVGVEFLQPLAVERIVNREHRLGVADLRQPADRRAADALRRAVGRDQLGVVGLQLFQLFEELIELLVRDFGAALDVVEVIVMVDLLAQFGDTHFGLTHRAAPGLGVDSSCHQYE